MKKYLFYVLIITISYSCDSTPISKGREAYKRYFKEILKDPSSLIIHSEEVISQNEDGITFVLDIGAKNSFGGYMRQIYTIRTSGKTILNIQEYDIRTLPKPLPKEKIEKVVQFTYKEKSVSAVIPITNDNFAKKEVLLSDDALAAKDPSDLQYLIKAAKEDNNGDFNFWIDRGGEVIKSGEKIMIDSCQTDYSGEYFKIKYKNKSLVIEQSAIF